MYLTHDSSPEYFKNSYKLVIKINSPTKNVQKDLHRQLAKQDKWQIIHEKVFNVIMHQENTN